VSLLLGDARAQAVPKTFFSQHVHDLSTPWPAHVGGIRLAACGPVACDYWYGIERSRGIYDWSGVDQWISKANAAGVDVLFPLFYTPSWASSNPSTACPGGFGNGTCFPPANMAYWTEWVTAAVTHLAGKVKYYEIWNEPNLVNYWQDPNNPTNIGSVTILVSMAKSAYNTIKSIDPNAQVVSPSPTMGQCSTGGYVYPDCWMNDYLAAGGGAYADIIAYHNYVQPDNPEDEITMVQQMKTVMANQGHSAKPLWVTEGSWGTTSNYPNPVAWVGRVLPLLWTNGVQRYYWYGYDDQTYGTLWDTSTNTPTAAGVAYDQVYNWMVGATMNGCTASRDPPPNHPLGDELLRPVESDSAVTTACRSSPPAHIRLAGKRSCTASPCAARGSTIWTCSLSRSSPRGYQGQIVWDTRGPSSYSVPSRFLVARNLAGETKPITGGVVTIGPEPIILETAIPQFTAGDKQPASGPKVHDSGCTASHNTRR
jgi:hypothetical protein